MLVLPLHQHVYLSFPYKLLVGKNYATFAGEKVAYR